MVASAANALKNISEFSSKLDPKIATNFGDTIANANAMIKENRDAVRDALRDVRDVAANFKLMSADLRSHPWKLLNPTEKDVRSDNLATAASEVKLAAEFVNKSATRLAEVAAQPGTPAGETAAQIKQLVEDLKAATAHLQASQEQLTKIASENK
jgi:ABC-type transporter Mla subunit MlaD